MTSGAFPNALCLDRVPKRAGEEISESEKFTRHLLAGGIAGVVSRTVTAPVDRIKVFYQVSKQDQHMYNVFKSMVNEGGLRSLWRGNLINVIKTTPKSSVRFAFYDQIKIHIKGQDNKELNIIERILAGSVAGLISQTLTFPLEVLKVRMTLSETGKYNGIIDAITSIYRIEGVKSFGKGYVPTLIAIIPHSGLDLAGYETLKKIGHEYKTTTLNSGELFIMSSISCMFGQIITYPLALVCTRMQAQENIEPYVSLTTRKAFQDIWDYEGVRGLYRGLVPNLIKFIPVVGITFVTYEKISTLLGITMTK